jgi:hypothetical protein
MVKEVNREQDFTDLQELSEVVFDNASPPTAGLGAAAGSANAGPAPTPAPAPPPEWRMRQRELRGQERKEEEAASCARGHRVGVLLAAGEEAAARPRGVEAPAGERASLPLPLEFGWIMLSLRAVGKRGVIAGPSRVREKAQFPFQPNPSYNHRSLAFLFQELADQLLFNAHKH